MGARRHLSPDPPGEPYSSVSPTHGQREGPADNGHFGRTCYYPPSCCNRYGDLEQVKLRNGNVASARDWRSVLEPVVARYQRRPIPHYFRADAAFAMPQLYDYHLGNFLRRLVLPRGVRHWSVSEETHSARSSGGLGGALCRDGSPGRHCAAHERN